MDGNLVRLGGVFGLLSVVALIPGLLVGFASGVGSLDDANSFFEGGAGAFVFFDGVIPLFFVVFFSFFLGSLHGIPRQAGGVLPTVALLGGGVYLVLAAVALAAEVLYPAAVLRFGEIESGGSFVVVLITLSAWLYHGSSMGGGRWRWPSPWWRWARASCRGGRRWRVSRSRWCPSCTS